jgi:hypothetical protein
MPYRPHRLEPNYPGPEVVTSPSPAPPVIVAAWCIGVERMNRRSLDRFTRDIWKRFDHRDLGRSGERSSAGAGSSRCSSALRRASSHASIRGSSDQLSNMRGTLASGGVRATIVLSRIESISRYRRCLGGGRTRKSQRS